MYKDLFRSTLNQFKKQPFQSGPSFNTKNGWEGEAGVEVKCQSKRIL